MDLRYFQFTFIFATYRERWIRHKLNEKVKTLIAKSAIIYKFIQLLRQINIFQYLGLWVNFLYIWYIKVYICCLISEMLNNKNFVKRMRVNSKCNISKNLCFCYIILIKYKIYRFVHNSFVFSNETNYV